MSQSPTPTSPGASTTSLRAVGRAAVQAVGTVALAVVAMHALLALAPGDAIDLLPNADAVRPVLAEQWGLDQPLPARILATLTGAATGDLGTSVAWRPGAPVSALIARPLLRSLGWWTAAGALSTALALALALPRGRAAAPARWAARAASLVPVFLLAHLAVHGLDEGALAAERAGWIARPAWFPLPLEPSAVRWGLAVAVLAIGSGALADGLGEARHAIRGLRAAPFALAAAARGEPERTWMTRHLALVVAELLATRAAVWLGGLVILEQVLLLDGAGRVLWRAAELRDTPLALGVTVVFAAWVAAARWLAATIRAVADPRPGGA